MGVMDGKGSALPCWVRSVVCSQGGQKKARAGSFTPALMSPSR